MAQRVSGQVANKLRFYRKTVAAAANTSAKARNEGSHTIGITHAKKPPSGTRCSRGTCWRALRARSRMRLSSTLAAGAVGSRPPNAACLAAGNSGAGSVQCQHVLMQLAARMPIADSEEGQQRRASQDVARAQSEPDLSGPRHPRSISQRHTDRLRHRLVDRSLCSRQSSSPRTTAIHSRTSYTRQSCLETFLR